MSVDPAYVYVGLWSDWTKGRVLGAVITVPSSTGAVVVALLAVFIHAVGMHLWHLVRFALHQLLTTDKGIHPIRRQTQALLRNDDSAGSTGVRLLELLWHWKGRSAPWARPSTLGVTALVFAACIALAGAFSSVILDTAQISVLLNSPYCGMIDESALVANDFVLGMDKLDAFVMYDYEARSRAATYTRQCYNGTSPTESCSGFAVPAITWATDFHAPCPFAQEMCDGPAMAQDTGRLNSNAIFGLNLAPSEQIDFRRAITCVPVVQDGFVQTVPYTLKRTSNASTPVSLADGSKEQTIYWYGGIESRRNYTITFDSIVNERVFAYSMTSLGDFGNPGGWEPIPALKRFDGSVGLVFIEATNIRYFSPVDDPIFSAHKPEIVRLPDGQNFTRYLADRAAGVLGCVDRHQICKAHDGDCSKLGLWSNIVAEAFDTLNLTDIQKATLAVFNNTVAWLTGPEQDTTDNLAAQRRLFMGASQFALPSNQWQIEVESWHARVMSTIQARLAMQATGPSTESIRRYIVPPATEAQKQLCRAQRVRIGQGFSNISLLGLLLAVIPGLLIILASLALDPVVSRLGLASRGRAARTLKSWNHDYVLQIQRVAYEGQSERKWENIDSEVPVTSDGEPLVPLRQGSSVVSPAYVGPPLEAKGLSAESRRLIG